MDVKIHTAKAAQKLVLWKLFYQPNTHKSQTIKSWLPSSLSCFYLPPCDWYSKRQLWFYLTFRNISVRASKPCKENYCFSSFFFPHQYREALSLLSLHLASFYQQRTMAKGKHIPLVLNMPQMGNPGCWGEGSYRVWDSRCMKTLNLFETMGRGSPKYPGVQDIPALLWEIDENGIRMNDGTYDASFEVETADRSLLGSHE